MNTKNFIVPHDFTQVAENALDHAIATARPLNAQIYVLHVVSKEKQIAHPHFQRLFHGRDTCTLNH